MKEDPGDWLRPLGIVVVEEDPDASSAPGLAPVPFVAAVARAAGVPDDDRRVRAVVRAARSAGRADLAIGAAKVSVLRHGQFLRAAVLPADRVAATVLHEIANALTGIAGWAQIANTVGGLPDRARTAVDTVHRTSSDALETARTLLARLRHGPAQGGEADVAETLFATASLLRPLAEDRDIALRVRVRPPEGLRAALPAVELRSIVTNLVKNAIEAVPAAGEVVVDAEAVEGNVVITVVDDGPGIPPEALCTIFEPGVSGKGSSGLGLSLVRELVTARGGEVSAENGRGRGARFQVRVPRAVDTPITATARLDSGVRRRSTGSMRRALRVLVVDDDGAIRDLVRTALELRGTSVVAKAGLVDASALDERFDLAVIDIRLPDGSGADLAASLRSRRLSRKILLTSGQADLADSPDADAVLRKPFALDDLLDLVDHLTLARPRRTQSAKDG